MRDRAAAVRRTVPRFPTFVLSDMAPVAAFGGPFRFLNLSSGILGLPRLAFSITPFVSLRIKDSEVAEGTKEERG
jgi:hypothetical protein